MIKDFLANLSINKYWLVAILFAIIWLFTPNYLLIRPFIYDFLLSGGVSYASIIANILYYAVGFFLFRFILDIDPQNRVKLLPEKKRKFT